MKFLCDQCKAKYQIADEKVKGRALKMKCRKCGNVIEIRATAIDARASQPASGETTQIAGLSEEAAAAALDDLAGRAAAEVAAARPAAPPRPGGSPSAPFQRAAVPPRAAPSRAAPPARRAGSEIGFHPSGGHSAPAARAGDAPSALHASTHASTHPSGASEASLRPESALASAFTRAAVAPPTVAGMPADSAPPIPVEEWYVAIDDVPVGPIRLTDLRAKYAHGAVNDDSLVWREGFEEWRPLRTIPDLHQLVREEGSGAFTPRPSLIPGPTSAAVARTTPPGAAGRRSTAGGSGTRPAVVGVTPLPSRTNVIPFQRQTGAAARALDERSHPPLHPLHVDEEDTRIAPLIQSEVAPLSRSSISARVIDDPFAPKLSPLPSTSPTGAADALELGGAPASIVGGALGAGDRMSVLDRISARTRGVPKGTVAVIAAACLFFGVLVAVVFVRRLTVVQERIIERQVNVPVSVFVPVPGSAPPVVVTAESPTPKLAARSGNNAPPTPSAAASAPSAASKKLSGLDIGPEAPDLPGATGAPRAAEGGLDGKTVEGVVGAKRVSVRKTCYEPYADKGAASARIVLHVQADGSVSAVDLAQTTGDNAIGSCVQRLAKGWRFPASGSGGTFAVPFIFSS